MKKYLHFLLFCCTIYSLYGQHNMSVENSHELDLDGKKERFERLLDSSNLYYERGDYRKDLELNFELLKIAFLIDDPYYIHKSYRNLAYDYLVLGDTVVAKESFEKAARHARLSKNESVLADTAMDLANIYSINEQTLDLAYDYHKESIDLFEKIGDSAGLAKAHYNTILTALEYNNFSMAYVHIIKARKFEKFGEPSYSVSLDGLLGQYYYQKENYEMANTYFKKVIEVAKEKNFPLVLEDTYYYLSENLKAQGNFEAAYDTRVLYEEVQSSNQQKMITSEVETASATYMVAEYRKDVQEAEEKNQLQAEIVSSKSRLNNILLVVSACFLILFLALFYAFRKRKQLVQKLKVKNSEYLKAKEETERLSKAKSKFFSTISHELRTPLYGVIGLTSILLEDTSLKSHSKDLKSLKFSADYLLALINDVLQINKIDSNSIDNEQTSFNIRDLIRKITSSFEYMRNQHNNKIHMHISDSVPEFIFGNSVRLSQVLMNLIGNACKFTENGDVYIIAETVKNTPSSNTIKFYIRDTGVGIPLEKQENIFEEFSQLESRNYKYQGTGLGLPIVKKLLQLDNAEISLKSEVGKGSLFSFTLEFAVAKENPVEELQQTYDESFIEGKRILVAEDNRINQMVTKKILEKNKLHCTIAENGELAVEKAKKESFDLILMDINMPVKNGIDATKEIRAFDKNIPILALTAVEVEEMRYTIFESGMDDIIVKPYDVTKFIQTISKNIIESSACEKNNEILRLKAI